MAFCDFSIVIRKHIGYVVKQFTLGKLPTVSEESSTNI